ncbi:MAG: cell division protein FtsI [Cyanobacteria bacterium SW_9_44_58]|nr:MAG: cell division protein FtsI [Cyanobacteria bacterium SW_9_44_58]
MIQNMSREFRRLVFVWLIFLLVSIGLGSRIYYLQIVVGDQLQAKANKQQKFALKPYIPRRMIIDRDGSVLATDRVVYELYAHPRLFKQAPKTIATKLAAILEDYSKSELLNKFEKRGTGIPIKDRLTEELASEIKTIRSDGLELIKKYDRYYPHEGLAANVVGYVQKDQHQGKTGVEFTQQAKLTRQAEKFFPVQRTARGNILPAYLPKNTVTFDDKKLQLTIDAKLQRLAHKAVEKQVKEFNAKRGTVIVMDVHSGELLSLVNEPSYNPNQYYEYDLDRMKNWAVTDRFEPGSTFKPINVAIALEAGLITPETEFQDPGKIKIGGWTVRNHDYYSEGGHGKIDIAEILQVSSNVGIIKIMQRMSPQNYYDKLQELGIEKPVGIDLTGETPGYLKPEFQFTNYEIEPATTAFGQGFSLTPIKLAQLHSSLANGGKLVTPHVVKGLVSQNGELVNSNNDSQKRVFSSETAKKVVEMMQTVVSEGSGQTAQIPGYRLGGKTGTAQKAGLRGYYTNEKITSFVSIFPANNPRYVVLAVVDEPKKPLAFGSTVAAPIVKEVIQGLISIEEIPPSHPEELKNQETDES